MIYTLTVNPSIDYIADVNDFASGSLNRTTAENVNAGGKGINVSIVLNNLGIETCALGFVAGFTGSEIERKLHHAGIKTDFVHLKEGFSRINVKLRSFCPNAVSSANSASAANAAPCTPNTQSPQNGTPEETEINGTGPEILPIYIEELLQKMQNFKDDDTLVMAGSIPKTLPETFYSRIMESFEDRQINFVVDATKELLLQSLKFKPFLIKPNLHELAELFNLPPDFFNSENNIEPYAAKLKDMGAQNVLVSMAGKGAVLFCKNGEIIKSGTPKCRLVNSVGAGDSMVAGFLAGFWPEQNYRHALKLAISAGSASAASQRLATKAQIEEMYRRMKDI